MILEISESIISFSYPVLLLLGVAGVGLGLLAILILLSLSGLISGSEVAFFSLTHQDYEELEQLNTASSRNLIKLREYPRMLLATILIANNLINIAIVLLSDFLISRIFPMKMFHEWANRLIDWLPFFAYFTEQQLAQAVSFLITVIAVTFLLVLFGEVAPKVYARSNKQRLSLIMARPMNFLMRIFYPFAYLLVNGTRVVERRLESYNNDSPSASQEDIDEAIELTVNSEDQNDESQRQDVDILKRIVQFSNVTVRQAMRSRGDVIAVDQEIDYSELLEVIRSSSYSRIPVFEEDFDKVVGLLYAKDLLGHLNENTDFDWRHLVRTEVMYVPDNKRLNDLLREFQREKMHMAIVVDEYGGSTGIITLEDVLEEVIGDIQDEFDEGDEVIYQRRDNHNFVFDGKTLLNDMCRIIEIPTNSFDDLKGETESIAGLLLERLGYFPEKDQEISCLEYNFKIMAMSDRRIEEVLVTLPHERE